MILYKRNAAGKPMFWQADIDGDQLVVNYGLVGGTKHHEVIQITLKNANDLESRIKAKRKEGYKELSELKDSSVDVDIIEDNNDQLKRFLNTYLPKYSTTQEGFVLPMLAKVLEDNKPFEKFGNMLGQWKINGLRCIVGAEKNQMDMFKPIRLTYHSRTGEDWTAKMTWMDDILLPKISKELVDMMVEEGACLDGELYLPGYQVNDINSFVKNTGLKQHYQLQYWCYDLCCENTSADNRQNIITWTIHNCAALFNSKEEHLNNKRQFITLLPSDCNSIESAIRFRNMFIDMGFEGLILRNPKAEYQFGKRNQAMFKFKKVDDGKFIIVDIKSEHKRSDLPLFVLRNDINDELFECSINKPHDVQKEILINKDKYIGKYMFVEYRERSGINSLPFHARGIDIVD